MKKLEEIANKAKNRFDFWILFIQLKKITSIVELGVYRGEYAEKILLACGEITKYYMIDPWRQLKDWNKPANVDNEKFEEYFNETLRKTKFAKNKIEILRGRTQDVKNEIKNDSLDFAYIDGDHTLKGISIDLVIIWDKIKSNGFIAGDDFCSNIWQHDRSFEPTLVFPFAVYFAEAKNVKIFALPFNQFLIAKGIEGFEFIDLTNGKYSDLSLLKQIEIKSDEVKLSMLSKLLNRF